MGAGGGMVRSSQRDARSSSLQRMVRRLTLKGNELIETRLDLGGPSGINHSDN